MKRGILIMKTFISVVVATIGAAGCTTMAMESERYYANRVATDKAMPLANLWEAKASPWLMMSLSMNTR